MKPSESPLDPKEKIRRWFQLGVFGVIIAGLAVVGWVWGPFIWEMVTDKDKLKEWVESHGSYAAPVFIVVQFVQVVIFFIPGEVTQIAGGLIFGQWMGLLLSYTGILLGSFAAFYFARIFEHAVLDLLIDRESLRKFDRIVYGRSGFWPMFILFLIPGIPKDVLCYVAGLTPMHVLVFLFINIVGRFPGILISSMFGDSIGQQDYTQMIIVASVTVIFLVLGWWFKDPIERLRKKYLMTAEEMELMGVPPERALVPVEKPEPPKG